MKTRILISLTLIALAQSASALGAKPTPAEINAITSSAHYSEIIEKYEAIDNFAGGIYLECRFDEATVADGFSTKVIEVGCAQYQWMQGGGPGCGTGGETELIAVLVPGHVDAIGKPLDYSLKSLTAVDAR